LPRPPAKKSAPDDARRFLAPYEDHARTSGIATQCAIMDRCHALLCENAELDDAFARALASHQRGFSRFEEPRTNLGYGERLSRAGRRVDARTPRRSALSAFEQLGAPLWAALATRELQATGERHHRTGVFDGKGRLTPRELEVALAVADGQTNQQVAVSPFLSLKTVEFHLRSIYRSSTSDHAASSPGSWANRMNGS
jgi:DNA-binding CsgD family transcriptional regulator